MHLGAGLGTNRQSDEHQRGTGIPSGDKDRERLTVFAGLNGRGLRVIPAILEPSAMGASDRLTITGKALIEPPI
jgi:hypothetical protein